MSKRTKFIGIAITLISLVTLITIGIQATAESEIEVVKSFDAESGELPEGISIDERGNMYVSLGAPFFVGEGIGKIWKISADGSETTVLLDDPDGPAPAGLVADGRGTVYYAVPDIGGPNAGVYRQTETGVPERLPGTENMFVPNGLALDGHGNLFVGDSVLGAVWRIPTRRPAPAEIWLQHDLVAGCPPEGFGVNGIAFWKGDLYAANTDRGALVRIPIARDGSPGEPELVAGNMDCEPEGLFGMDGIAFDVRGNVYATLVLQNQLVRIDPTDGTVTTLLTGDDGLWNPASVAFGTTRGNRKSIFITNYAVIPPGSDLYGPAVLKYEVGVPGLPLP